MPRSFDPLVATLPLFDQSASQSKAANLYQMPLVTLPPSHSHYVIRMDPATQLKNGAVLLVAYVRESRRGGGGLDEKPAGSSFAHETHAFDVTSSWSGSSKAVTTQPTSTKTTHIARANTLADHQRHQTTCLSHLPRRPATQRTLAHTRMVSD